MNTGSETIKSLEELLKSLSGRIAIVEIESLDNLKEKVNQLPIEIEYIRPYVRNFISELEELRSMYKWLNGKKEFVTGDIRNFEKSVSNLLRELKGIGYF